MSVSMHPVTANLDPLDYLPLVRTYLELDKLYFLDMPYALGKVRLTHMASGVYVIYGRYGELRRQYDEHEYIGADEQLYMCVPPGMMRVRTGPMRFEPITLPYDIEYRGLCNYWALRPMY